MTRKTLSLKANRNKQSPAQEPASDKALDTDPKTQFLNGVAIHPAPHIQLELGSSEFVARALDLIAPIGRGQRGLIVAPPGSGKTTLLEVDPTSWTAQG